MCVGAAFGKEDRIHGSSIPPVDCPHYNENNRDHKAYAATLDCICEECYMKNIWCRHFIQIASTSRTFGQIDKLYNLNCNGITIVLFMELSRITLFLCVRILVFVDVE